eukprot:6198374-Pleurochrysis_carterae.AAC.3
MDERGAICIVLLIHSTNTRLVTSLVTRDYLVTRNGGNVRLDRWNATGRQAGFDARSSYSTLLNLI